MVRRPLFWRSLERFLRVAERVSDFERPEKFEILFRELYDVFPNGSKSKNVLDRVIVTDNVKNSLVENGFLIEQAVAEREGEDKVWYTLGPQGVLLVNSWNVEELTQKMTNLTYFMAILTFLNLAFLITQVVT